MSHTTSFHIGSSAGRPRFAAQQRMRGGRPSRRTRRSCSRYASGRPCSSGGTLSAAWWRCTGVPRKAATAIPRARIPSPVAELSNAVWSAWLPAGGPAPITQVCASRYCPARLRLHHLRNDAGTGGPRHTACAGSPITRRF